MRLLAILLMFGVEVQAGALRAGRAQVVITPPKGAPMAGYYVNRAAAGVHDDLHAKALVFEKDGVKAALVACDLSGIPRPIIEEARKLIAASTGIPAGAVMISATHTHTGPVVASGRTRYNLEGEMRDIALQYAAGLPEKIAESVRLAHASLEPSRVFASIGHEDTLAFNRRYHMKDGSVAWNPGKRNPNIVRPAGPIDPDVPVVYVETEGRKPLAAYVNYALHLDTVGGMEYSADYPYTLASLLANVKGPGLVALFTIGCAGNVNHIDVSTSEPQKGHGEAARIGTVLAAAVLKSLKASREVDAGAIRTRTEVVNLPLPEFGPDDLAKARDIQATFGKPNAAPFADLVRAAKIIDVAERQGKPLDAEVQVVALGDQIAWVGLPGEVFVELGMTIKRVSPFPYTIVAELANGSIGYVPDRKAYAEGAYEVISARCAAGSGEMLADAATRLLVSAYEESLRK